MVETFCMLLGARQPSTSLYNNNKIDFLMCDFVVVCFLFVEVQNCVKRDDDTPLWFRRWYENSRSYKLLEYVTPRLGTILLQINSHAITSAMISALIETHLNKIGNILFNSAEMRVALQIIDLTFSSSTPHSHQAN